MNILQKTKLDVLLMKQAPGLGKNLLQNFLAYVLTTFYEDSLVMLLHCTPEACDDNYRKYGVDNPKAMIL